MYQGSREGARSLTALARPGDTLLVWGYRPDLFVETRLAAGAPFLDSQPLTGVFAERHLVNVRPSAPQIAASNRQVLRRTQPTFIVDGLGPYNPRLAIASYADLGAWLARYQEVARVNTAIVYGIKAPNK